MKRFASHYLFVPGRGFLKQHVVEVEGGVVRRFFPLTEEIESVEWRPGMIELFKEEGESSYSACLLYPFDFVTMQPVDGTQRRPLR